jgi:hypothetical protein
MKTAEVLTVADIPRLLGELRQEKFYGFVLSPTACSRGAYPMRRQRNGDQDRAAQPPTAAVSSSPL